MKKKFFGVACIISVLAVLGGAFALNYSETNTSEEKYEIHSLVKLIENNGAGYYAVQNNQSVKFAYLDDNKNIIRNEVALHEVAITHDLGGPFVITKEVITTTDQDFILFHDIRIESSKVFYLYVPKGSVLTPLETYHPFGRVNPDLFMWFRAV